MQPRGGTDEVSDLHDDDLYRVEANADKALFVTMLVKDIELLPAVVDLVDNAVDSARATSPSNLSRHSISLRISPEQFVVLDNCGGIDLNVARHYAFRFGRPKDYPGVPGSVGEFGVGMKRALFKLGRDFTVASRTSSTSFELRVDVDEWLGEPGPDWQFRMSSVDPVYDPATAGTGTSITVRRLHETVAQDFENPLVLGQLREQIRLRHQAVLEQGLRISLNGEQLRGYAPALLSGDGFKPINRRFTITRPDGDVHAQIIAGIAASGSDDTADDGDAEQFRSPGDAGWWLFCNNRLLLFRERSPLTGWGDGAPAYHPQFRRFRGYAYLTSLNPSLLPWNTTKTGVDQDSRIWRQIQGEIKQALVEVVAVINRMKSERQQADNEAEMPITRAAERARSTLLTDLESSLGFGTPKPRPLARKDSALNIQYRVERHRYRDAAAALGVSTAADVGRQTFEYFFEREVGD